MKGDVAWCALPFDKNGRKIAVLLRCAELTALGKGPLSKELMAVECNFGEWTRVPVGVPAFPYLSDDPAGIDPESDVPLVRSAIGAKEIVVRIFPRKNRSKMREEIARPLFWFENAAKDRRELRTEDGWFFAVAIEKIPKGEAPDGWWNFAVSIPSTEGLWLHHGYEPTSEEAEEIAISLFTERAKKYRERGSEGTTNAAEEEGTIDFDAIAKARKELLG